MNIAGILMQAIDWRGPTAKGLVILTLVILLVPALWYYFSGLDLSLVALRIRGGGFALLLVLLPYGLVFLTESLAWQFAIRGARRPGLGKLYLIRMASDALFYSLPGGVAVAEATRPVLLQRQCGIGLTEGIGSCIITKITIALAQVVYVLFGFILVTIFYPGVTIGLGVGNGIATYVVVGFSLLCAIGLLSIPFTGPRLTQFFHAISRLPVSSIRKFIFKMEPTISRLDIQVGRFARDHTPRFIGSLIFSFVAWILISVETYLILTFLGSEPTFTQAVALEATASILRLLFFMLPAGIGASEVGFVTLLVAFGFPDAIMLGAAYIALKRLKEAGWVALGYSVFWFLGFNPFKRGRVRSRIGASSLHATRCEGEPGETRIVNAVSEAGF
jgi:hypothetical protein